MPANYVEEGEGITVRAPTGGVSSGDVILRGAALGVCLHDADAGAALELGIEGVFTVTAATGDTLAAGDALYWDSSASALTSVTTGNTLCAIAYEAKATGVVLVAAKLPGFPIV